MSDLAVLIQSDFPSESLYIIEVYIIDGNGDPFEVFRGYSKDLTGEPLMHVMDKLGVLYFFTVIGMHKDMENELDSFKGLVLTKDYSWLVQPSQPSLISKNQSSIKVKWDLVYALGLHADPSLQSLTYHVEVAEGQAWCRKTNDVIFVPSSERGLSTPWISVAGGVDLQSLEISGLQAATWYHIRVVVSSRGIKRTSSPIHVATAFDIPLAPAPPRIYVNPQTNVVGTQATPSLLARWTAPPDNGGDILMYQVQLLVVDKNGRVAIGDRLLNKNKIENEGKESYSSPNNVDCVRPPTTEKQASTIFSNDRPKSPNAFSRPGHKERFLIPSFQSKNVSLTNSRPYDLPDVNTNGLEKDNIFFEKIDGYSTWKTIHKNINNKCIIVYPGSNISEYRIRVRAKNMYGWSPYSILLVADNNSYPGIFQTVSTSEAYSNPSLKKAISKTNSSVDIYHERVLNSQIARSIIEEQRLLKSRGLEKLLSRNASVVDSSTHLSSILSSEFLEGAESLFSADSLKEN